jgi:hypothetical protein
MFPRLARLGRPKRYHLELEVDDLAKAVERCLELGAGKPVFQPGGDRGQCSPAQRGIRSVSA